jgi:hypothetical protein
MQNLTEARRMLGLNDHGEEETFDSKIDAFICPITQEIMRDPVMTKYGHCFEKRVIETWVSEKGKCPLTN